MNPEPGPIVNRDAVNLSLHALAVSMNLLRATSSLAQINPCVGDLAGNVERCLAAIGSAKGQEADLVLLPEMAVPGHPPRDILFDASFAEATFAATADLAARAADGPPVLVGSLDRAIERWPGHPGLLDAAFLLSGGKASRVAAKRCLDSGGAAFETRWFVVAPPSPLVEIAGKRIGVVLGEDLWREEGAVRPATELLAAGAQLLICLAASHFRRGVPAARQMLAARVGKPLIFVNLCGATDEQIFDGSSFALRAGGGLVAALPSFEEGLTVVDPFSATSIEPRDDASPEGELFSALTLGIRDFARKNRIDRAFVGLSGGVDSAVVAAIAVEALGPGCVTAAAVPSRYTDPRSTESARQLAEALGVAIEEVPLESLHSSAEAALGDLLAVGTCGENVQARLRALVLMSFVNRFGGMLLNTSNKTELSLGYGTLYGDSCGTLCPIGDLTKPEVVALARWINREREIIPRFTLERPPTAELSPGQVDPFDYDEISPRMETLVRADQSDAALRRSEHKRWQMGVILAVSPRPFGTGRLIPITRK